MLQTQTGSLFQTNHIDANPSQLSHHLERATSFESTTATANGNSQSSYPKRQQSPSLRLNLLPASKKTENLSPASTLLNDLQAHKTQGDNHFRAQAFQEAITSYCHALEVFNEIRKSWPEAIADPSLSLRILANISQCLLKLHKFEESLAYSMQILRMDAQYIKAYYRAGFALKALNRDEEALEILRHGIPFVRDSDDKQSKDLYFSLYNEVVKTHNKNIQAMKDKMRDFFNDQPKKKVPKSRPQFVLDRETVLWSIYAGILTGSACFMLGKKLGTSTLSLAGNTLGCSLTLGVTSYRSKAFCLSGLLLFNYLLYKFMK